MDLSTTLPSHCRCCGRYDDVALQDDFDYTQLEIGEVETPTASPPLYNPHAYPGILPCCNIPIHIRCFKAYSENMPICPSCHRANSFETPIQQAIFITTSYLNFNAERMKIDEFDGSLETVNAIFLINVALKPFLNKNEDTQKQEISSLMYGRDDLAERVVVFSNPWNLPLGKKRTQALKSLYLNAIYVGEIESEPFASRQARLLTFTQRHVALNPALTGRLSNLFIEVFKGVSGYQQNIQRLYEEFEASSELIEVKKKRCISRINPYCCCKFIVCSMMTTLVVMIALIIINSTK